MKSKKKLTDEKNVHRNHIFECFPKEEKMPQLV